MRARRACLVAIATALTLSGTAGADVTQQEARGWEPDLAAAREYAESRAGHARFAVFDMRGRLHHDGGGGRAAMASTFKVMLMVAYLRQDHVDGRDLNDGEKSLIRTMIRRSDNESATRIRDILGRGPIEALADRARMKHFHWNAIWGYCRTSARDQALFMRNLRRHVPDRHWGFAKRQLAHIVSWQRWGIGRLDLPRGWDLYFKGGWAGHGAIDHQIAQLRNDRRRIGVAVLTEGSPSRAYGNATLEGVFRRLLRRLPT